jgi:hypothetical protein
MPFAQGNNIEESYTLRRSYTISPTRFGFDYRMYLRLDNMGGLVFRLICTVWHCLSLGLSR